MADPPGLLGNLFPGNNPQALYEGLLSDPATQQQMNQRALAAMAGSFAESAMPTRMPTPFGAVLGHAAAAGATSGDAVMAARLQAAQAQQASAQAQLSQAQVGGLQTLTSLEAQALNQGGTPTLPGTIGTPTVSTVPHDAGPGWLAGFAIPPGTSSATFDPKLGGSEYLENLAKTAMPIALPGYTIQKTSGERPGATVAGGGGESQHAKDNAADFQIYGPDGKPIDNKGPDSSGAYGKLALTMRMIAPPELKPWLGWGGNFSTGTTGPEDLMHFDWAGDRGHRGTLAQLEQQWVAANAPGGGGPRPVQLASTGSTAGLLNQPATGQVPSGTPPGQPGLLTQGPVPPGAFTGAGSIVRGSWYGNSPGWSDPSDRGNQANGMPVSAGAGIALPIAKDAPNFGQWYDVTFPNGKTLRLQQTDVGPDAKGRGIDVNSVAADQAGYTPKTFPTDQPISVRPAAGGPQVAQAGPVPTATGQPPPLVMPPGPPATAPPITQPQPPGTAPNIPGAPSPQRIALAQRIVALSSALGRTPPATEVEIANFALIGPKKAAELPYTPARPGAVLNNADGTITVMPSIQPGPPDPATHQPTQVYRGINHGIPYEMPMGPSGASPGDIAGQQAAPKPIELDPTKTVVFPPGTAGATQWIDAQRKGQKLPDNVQILANGAVQVGATTPTQGQIDKTQEDFFKLKDAAAGARQGIYETQQLRQQLHQIGMSGPATTIFANLGSWAQSLGVLNADQVKKYIGVSPASEEAAEKMSQDLLGEVLKSTFPQRITNSDITAWKNTVPRGTMLQGAYDLLIDKILMPKLEQAVGRYGSVAGLAASGDPQLRTYSGTLEAYDQAHPIGSFVHQYAYGPGGHRLRLDKDAQGKPAWVDDIQNPVQP